MTPVEAPMLRLRQSLQKGKLEAFGLFDFCRRHLLPNHRFEVLAHFVFSDLCLGHIEYQGADRRTDKLLVK